MTVKFSKKTFIITVSIAKGCYRHIKISASCTLFDFHKDILNAFGFSDDHAHAFFMDNKRWGEDSYYCDFIEDEDRFTTEYRLGEVLHEGMKFLYLFDFGDEWTFNCKVLHELDESSKGSTVIKSVGEAPAQYPDCDDDECGEYSESVRDDDYDLHILEMYKELKLPQKTVELIHNYFDSAVRIYGAVPAADIMKMYNSDNKQISSDKADMLIEIIGLEEQEYYIENGIVSEFDYPDSEALDELFSARKNIIPYAPSIEQILDYSSTKYIEGLNEFKNLSEFFIKTYRLPYDESVYLTELLYSICSHSYSLADTFAELKSSGIVIRNREQLHEFYKLYSALRSAARVHKYNGHTPKEMCDIEREASGNLFEDTEFIEDAQKVLLDYIEKAINKNS